MVTLFFSGSKRLFCMLSLFQIKAGIVMNIIGFLVIFLAAITWMPKIYQLDYQNATIFSSINTTTFATVTTAKG